MTKSNLLNIAPKDLKSIIQLAYNIGRLKAENDKDINLSDSWFSKYNHKMNIIKNRKT